MNRRVARFLHSSTNFTGWFESPDWDPGTPFSRFCAKILRKLPFSVTELQKRMFFDRKRLFAIGGETVVVANGKDKVDKFMFRYPGNMPLEEFYKKADAEIAAMTSCLAGIAQPTEVSIKPSNIFRCGKPIKCVTQTQPKLDLAINAPLTPDYISAKPPSAGSSKTIRDLRKMLTGITELSEKFGFYPDISKSSGNLRVNISTGSVTLIDVMPIHSDGSRLIGDFPNNPHLLSQTQESIKSYREICDAQS